MCIHHLKILYRELVYLICYFFSSEVNVCGEVSVFVLGGVVLGGFFRNTVIQSSEY